ncbi:LOW QUALITY PROTEIN: hypothetical protein PHMEG_00016568 [Phytophthora megakarya]|uniref:Transposase n=1 Tax=Phytophthora megakarya TaxID=4795 RepID=A0A225W0K9_9STRA|nr:LOW QUALITY PROTEIN: hypothetical protein PHMEG_00016568 [Phytophthora megakarya]
MEPAVTTQHAHPSTVLHCLYGYYNMATQGRTRIYHKDVKTIGNWIHVYETTGTFQRVNRADNKFTKPQRNWLYQYYQQYPLSYLDEAREAFIRAHLIISISSVWRIIHELGFTWKVLERRAFR